MTYTRPVRVTWDERKNTTNRKKHGVSFEDASELLTQTDESHLVLFDEEHSGIEDRFISIGPIRKGLVLVVWTERVDDEIRIISARWATKREVELYRTHVREST